MRVVKTLVLFQLLLCSIAFSSINDALEFEHLTMENGLANNTVVSIVQDRYGFMWYGTRDGLVRYDGYNFKTFRHNLQDSLSLPANHIRKLLLSKKGDLYIGTKYKGVCVFNYKDENFRMIDKAHDPVSYNFLDFFESKDGKIWIGTWEGLSCYNPILNQLKVIDIPDIGLVGKKHEFVSSITEDRYGNIYMFCSGNAIAQYFVKDNRVKWIKYTDHMNELMNRGGKLFVDSRDNLWIGTEHEGVYLYNLNSYSIRHFSKSTKHFRTDIIMDFHETSDNRIWIATDGDGVYVYDYEYDNFEHFQNESFRGSSLNTNAVYDIFESKSGVLWFGHYGGGVDKYSIYRQKFEHYSSLGEPNERLNNKSVLCFDELSTGEILIGTDGGGINVFDKTKRKFKYLTVETGHLKSNIVKSLYVDLQDNIWAGSYGDGVSILDQAKMYKNIDFSDSLTSRHLMSPNVWQITFFDNQTILLGLLDSGFDIINPKTFEIEHYHYQAKNGLTGRNIHKIFIDSKNRIWIGTEMGGLDCFNIKDKTFVNFKTEAGNPKSISANHINDIIEDEKGNIWIATQDVGMCMLSSFANKEFIRFYHPVSFPFNSVTSIVPNENTLWLSTDKGVVKFNIGTKQFHLYTVDDNLQSQEYNKGSKWKDKDGYIYFGGNKGFNRFHPDKILHNHETPLPLITTLVTSKGNAFIERKSVFMVNEIQIDHTDNVWKIGFSSLDFVNPSKNRFKYKLKGFDNDWLMTEAGQYEVTYMNIEPGEYELQVKGTNSDGIWSRETVVLKIVVAPPFYKTLVFRIGFVLFLIIVLILIFHFRTKRIQNQNLRLKKEVEKQTSELKKTNDFLSEKNEEIIFQNEKLEQINHENNSKTAQILTQQQEIILQKNELEEKNISLDELVKNKEKFFSIVAHDLKNPVLSIVNSSDFLENKLDYLSSSELSVEIEKIHSSAESLNLLIGNLMKWGLSQDRTLAPKFEAIEINTLLYEAFELLQGQAIDKGVSFAAELSTSYLIKAEQNMLGTVIRNVLSNAIKYTPTGGTIKINTFERGNRMSLVIEDNGIGMEDRLIQALFEGEKLVSSKGTNNELGTGLGLMLCKEFVEKMDGELEIESELNDGTTVYINLPLEGVVSEANEIFDKIVEVNDLGFVEKDIHAEFDEEFKSIKGKKIIIVEDNDALRRNLKFLLSDIFEIREATNGEEALALLAEYNPDLIITDLNMPVMDGFELCQKIKSNNETSHITCFIITADLTPASELRAYEVGVDSFITKPFERRVLLAQVKGYFRNYFSKITAYQQTKEISTDYLANNDTDKKFLSELTDYLSDNYTNPKLNAEIVAKSLGVSRTMLYSKVKSLTSQSVNEFIRTFRLKKATTFLLQGDMNISEVAYEVGFNSLSYFTRSFSKQFGVSPKEYIENNGKLLFS